MNTTISRIAASAPVAVALFGFSFGSAQAAPYEPGSSDKVQVQPADDSPKWDVDLPVSDDLPEGDPPADPDDVGPADPADEPADEPEDEPSEDDANDEESDEDAGDESKASGNGGSSFNGGGSNGGSSKGAKDAEKSGERDEAEATPLEAADVQLTPASARGVQVPTEVVAAAGAALAAVVGWATYRRMKVTAAI
jgi:hypothetical protein